MKDNIIQIGGQKADPLNMEERIRKVKAERDAEYKEKAKKLLETNIPIEELFTPEDIEEIERRNAFFNGTVANLTKVQKHQKIVKIGKWLDAHSFDVLWCDAEPLSYANAGAAIIFELKELCIFKALALQAIIAMSSLADSVCLSALTGKSVRLSFFLDGVFSESVGEELVDEEFVDDEPIDEDALFEEYMLEDHITPEEEAEIEREVWGKK